MDVYHWSDEDDVRSPPNPLPPLIAGWGLQHVQQPVEMEEDSQESDREEEAGGDHQEDHGGPW